MPLNRPIKVGNKVILNEDIPNSNLKKGTTGTISEVNVHGTKLYFKVDITEYVIYDPSVLIWDSL